MMSIINKFKLFKRLDEIELQIGRLQNRALGCEMQLAEIKRTIDEGVTAYMPTLITDASLEEKYLRSPVAKYVKLTGDPFEPR